VERIVAISTPRAFAATTVRRLELPLLLFEPAAERETLVEL
jgi:hypothetical protein